MFDRDIAWTEVHKRIYLVVLSKTEKGTFLLPTGSTQSSSRLTCLGAGRAPVSGVAAPGAVNTEATLCGRNTASIAHGGAEWAHPRRLSAAATSRLLACKAAPSGVKGRPQLRA